MTQSSTAHTVSLQQTLQSVESSIVAFGQGPYTPQQAEKLKELNQLKQNLLKQVHSSTQHTSQQGIYSVNTPQAISMNPPNPVAKVLPGMMEMSSIKTEVQPIVLSQNAVNTQLRQSNVDDDKILNKHRLQELVKEIDPNEQLDDDVEEMLMQITDDFIESVVGAACDLAKHRNGNSLEVKDLKLHLENKWNISVPGYASDEIRPFKKSIATEAHRQRLALIRKASKK